MSFRHVPAAKRAFAALSLVTGFAAPLQAQSRPDKQEMVPAVLASTAMNIVLGSMTGRGPFEVSSRLPADFPAVLAPPHGARVAGTVSFGPFRLAAFTFPRGANGFERYDSVLVRAGAKRGPDAASPSIKHGFAPSTTEQPAEARAYCMASRSVNVIRADTLQSPNLVILFWTPTRAEEPSLHTTCDPDYAEFARGHNSAGSIELPPLLPPRGVRLTEAGRSGSDDEQTWSASVDTSMTADTLVAHFARQFAQGGWTVGPPATNAQTGSVSLSTTNEKGVWRGALVVVSAPDRREILVRMARARPY